MAYPFKAYCAYVGESAFVREGTEEAFPCDVAGAYVVAGAYDVAGAGA